MIRSPPGSTVRRTAPASSVWIVVVVPGSCARAGRVTVSLAFDGGPGTGRVGGRKAADRPARGGQAGRSSRARSGVALAGVVGAAAGAAAARGALVAVLAALPAL